jgi:hypothetical protein
MTKQNTFCSSGSGGNALPQEPDTVAKIKTKCAEITELLISKNNSYGNSALKPRPIFGRGSTTASLEARIDDKLNRIASGNMSFENYEDTVLDLLGYLILLLIARDELKDSPPRRDVVCEPDQDWVCFACGSMNHPRLSACGSCERSRT